MLTCGFLSYLSPKVQTLHFPQVPQLPDVTEWLKILGYCKAKFELTWAPRTQGYQRYALYLMLHAPASKPPLACSPQLLQDCAFP